MPRPGIRACLLKRFREYIGSRGWPIPGRRLVSGPPEVSLDVTKQVFMEKPPPVIAAQFLPLAMAL